MYKKCVGVSINPTVSLGVFLNKGMSAKDLRGGGKTEEQKKKRHGKLIILIFCVFSPE